MGLNTTRAPLSTVAIDPKTGKPYVNQATGETLSIADGGAVDYAGKYGVQDGNPFVNAATAIGGGIKDAYGAVTGIDRTDVANFKHKYLDPLNIVGDPGNVGKYLSENGLGGIVTTDYNGPNGRQPGPATSAGQAAAAGAAGAGSLNADLAYQRSLVPTITGAYPGERAAPQLGPAPPVRAPSLSVRTAASPQQVSTAPVNARQALGAAPVQTQNVAAPAPVTAQTVQAQQAATTLAGPAALGTAQQGVASTATGATINTGQSDEVRADQRSLVGDLRGVVAGTAPSVAEQQYRQSLADINDRGAAQVAAATGSGRAAAKRAALYATADATSRSARDLALIRAQEAATARGQEADVLGMTRGQDVGLATKQADLTQDVSKTNAGLETTTSNSNAELGTRTSLANAGAVNDISKTNAGMETDTSRFNAGQGNTVALGNAGNKLSADTGNVTRATDVATGNANRDVTVATGNADRSQALNTFNTGQGNAVDMSNQNAQIGVDTGNANRNLSGDQFNTGQLNDMTKFGAGQQFDASKINSAQELQRQIANVDATLKARGMDDASRDAYIKNLLAQSGQTLNTDVAKAGIDAGIKADNNAFIGGLIKAGGTYLAAA